MHKRLSLLEANSTLSLQYIEEQSRILRDAFAKVEKRQLLKTSSFLETLNSTVLSELREFRNQYDQIWQSTVLELSAQREVSAREAVAFSGRLSMLADELVWAHRIAYLQFILLALCLGLVIFRSNASAPLEQLGLLQSLQAFGRGAGDSMSFMPRSGRSVSDMGSPPLTPSRPSSGHGLFGRRFAHLRGLSDAMASSEDHSNRSSPPSREARSSTSGHLRVGSDETTLAGDMGLGAEERSRNLSVDYKPVHLTPRSENGDPFGGPPSEAESDIAESRHGRLRRAVSSPPLGWETDEGADAEDVQVLDLAELASVATEGGGKLGLLDVERTPRPGLGMVVS